MQQKILLALFVLTFPLVAYVSTLPPQRFRNEITEWGDPGSEAYRDFARYRQKFGVNQFIVVGWPGCDLNDPRVDEITEKIETQLAGFVQQVSSGQRAYWELRNRTGLSEKAALKRLRNSFIADSSLSTAVGFNLTEKGRRDRNKVIPQLEQILTDSQVDPDTVTFAGLGHNLYSLDQEGLTSPFRMVPLILLLALVLTILFVRNFWLAFFINALGTYTGCLAFNFVYLADIDMNAIIWPLPTLTMLLTVSAALHFLSYFRKTAESVLIDDSPTDRRFDLRWAIARQARNDALKPVLYCTFTTAIGLLSLLLSSSEPVRQFGLFGAMSITAANVLLLIWLPAFMPCTSYADSCHRRATARSAHATRHDAWHWLGKFTHSFRIPIVVVCLLVLAWCVAGIPKIKTGCDLGNFFPAGHRVLTDVAAIENSTPLNSVELLLQFQNHNTENDWLRIRGIKALTAQIIQQTPFESCISAATFAPTAKGSSGGIRGAIKSTQLRELKAALVENGLLHQDNDQQETWRVSCRYSATNKIDISDCRENLTKLAEELFYQDGDLVIAGERLSLTTTGEFVLFDYIDQQFFYELMITYATAFGIIMLVIVLVLRNVMLCLSALLPNIFPAVVVLGTAGHLGYSLDVASLMTASVALGIAVDDTLHFLLWRQKMTSGGDKTDSKSKTNDTHGGERVIESTMRYCGFAMLQTSTIIGLSIFLYAFCGFLPTVRFGVLLCAMMFAALLGDLLLLPALLGRSK